MAKKDLPEPLRALYFPSAKEPVFVDVPAMQFAMVDGEGAPDTSREFAEAIGALYGVAYTIKFAAKKAGIPMRIGANSGSLPKHLADLAQHVADTSERVDDMRAFAERQAGILGSLDGLDKEVAALAARIAGLAEVHDLDAHGPGYRFVSATDPEDDPLRAWKPMRVTLAPTGTVRVAVRERAVEPVQHRQQSANQVGRRVLQELFLLALNALAKVIELGLLAQQAVVKLRLLLLELLGFGSGGAHRSPGSGLPWGGGRGPGRAARGGRPSAGRA